MAYVLNILASELSPARLFYWSAAAGAAFSFSLLVLLVLGAF
jgi:hypothetical protein